MSDTLLVGSKGAIARCPKCHEFIDASFQTCRFCHAVLTKDELQAAVALQSKITFERARINNWRAFTYSVMSLAGAVALGLVRFAQKTPRDLVLRVMQFAVANKVTLTVLIALIMVVILWRRQKNF
jgi:hypothetical protein